MSSDGSSSKKAGNDLDDVQQPVDGHRIENDELASGNHLVNVEQEQAGNQQLE